MKQDNFSSYHPIINFVYFVLVIGYSMFIMHPVFLGLSCVGGMAYYIYLKKWKALKTALWMMLLVFLISAAINPLFNHQGVTLIMYLKWKSSYVGVNPLWSCSRYHAGECIELVFLLSGGNDIRQVYLFIRKSNSGNVVDFFYGASICS